MSRIANEVGSLLGSFLVNEEGVSAIEYGLLAAGIALAIIATIVALGSDLTTTFSDVSDGLN